MDNNCNLRMVSALIFLIMAASAQSNGESQTIEIRGEVATGDFTWNPQNFAGFYYDLDDNIGTEQLTTTITEGNKLQKPNGVTYTTTATKKSQPPNYYQVIGFLGKPYLAGYVLDEAMPADDQVLHQKSDDECSLCKGQLQEILINNDSAVVLSSNAPLTLSQGYKLHLKSIDYGTAKINLELTKDGKVVDSKAIPTYKNRTVMADKIYYYKKDVGNQKGLVTIAVYFGADYKDSKQTMAIIDRIWQISDTSTIVENNAEYGKMRISSISADTITMDNQDNTLSLDKNESSDLMGDFKIKTADADRLRYYLYKDVQQPGEYEIRGSVATGDFTWNSQNFPGFYYDIDDNIGTEQLTTTITKGNKLQEPTGIQYTTTAQKKAFEFEGWGYFNVIAFMGALYFAGYVQDENLPAEDQVLYAKSADECSQCDEQLQKILIDNEDEMVVRSGDSIKLKEGYELLIKGISEEKGIILELRKDEKVIDIGIKSLADNGTMVDKTYYYRTDVGDQKGLVIIAVHFKNADKDFVNIDGIWQISDIPTEVSTDTANDKMRISPVSPDTITMDNQDNSITLSKNKDIDLMDGMKIKVADANEMRYYPYKIGAIAS
ncbi:MAG: S-layer protein [Methanotrichaceae archaeon]|nr:S-layer protein [Methanotrichaceae archaeon]